MTIPDPTTWERPDWHSFAACRGVDPDLFFPETGCTADAAKAICRACPVILCCQDGHVDEMHGVWFGTGPKERRHLRRLRRANTRP